MEKYLNFQKLLEDAIQSKNIKNMEKYLNFQKLLEDAIQSKNIKNKKETKDVIITIRNKLFIDITSEDFLKLREIVKKINQQGE